ncbi:GerAB/ArcD/ProY family transporter [Paenibacillus silvisoli]|uniref:GerAB/ArcD/ProY family transporter n=1 Tax=Paenibacillus silvisoli TaxID=3110539 RepID=UPI002803B6CE|nr:endospore germination permease [Paenibacillus silvisoli]
MNLDKISPFQLGALSFTFMSGFSTLYLLEAQMLKQDAWMANISAVTVIIIIVYMIAYVQNKFGDKNMLDIIELLFGKWISKFIYGIYVVSLLGLGVLSLRSLSFFYITAILPKTSPTLIMFLILVVTTYAVSLGLGTIVRSVLVILPMFLILIAVICILSFRNVDINPFLPLFQKPVQQIYYGAMISFGFPFGKMGVIFLLFSEVTNKKKIFLSCSVGVVLSCAYLLTSTYLAMGSLGMNLFAASSFPFFSAIQLVKFGEYLERMEIIIIGIWTIFTLFEIIIVQYALIKVIGKLFSITNTQSFIIPMGGILLALSMNSYFHFTDLVDYDLKILPFTVIIPAVTINILIVVLTRLKKRHAH